MLDNEIKLTAMDVCRRIADRNKSRIISACLYGSQVSGYARKESDIDLLLILEPYPDGVLYNYVPYEGRMFSVLVVDKTLFGKDVKDAYLGEFVAGRLLTPYQALTSKEYLREVEVAVKTRFAKESIEGLVSDYPEIWAELLISPEFFVFDKMRSRVSIYPPVRYSYVRMLEGDRREVNLLKMVTGFEKALSSLMAENLVTWDGKYYRLPRNAKIKRRLGRIKLNDIVKTIKRVASAYVVHGYAGRGVNLLDVAQEFASKLSREIETGSAEKALEEPDKHLFLSSSAGLINLHERMPIERLSDTLAIQGGYQEKTVDRLGSAVNSVFLIRLKKDGEEKLVVAKKYRDWHGFKWFPLALWTIGAQRFALRGRSRMANEYTALVHLRQHGFSAPEIIDLSWADRVLYRQYISGHGFEQIIRNAFLSEDAFKEAAPSFWTLGKTLAGIHATGLVLGDPKPENILMNERRDIFFVDLEQAIKKDARPTWDLAELLYFTSHLTIKSRLAQRFARTVLDGYLTIGDKRTVKEISSPRFTRVFAVVSAPHVLRAVAKVCKDVGTGPA